MADSVGGQTPLQTLSARDTRFRFGEWHTLGISFGSQGRFISVDGRVVAHDGLSLPLTAGGDPHRQIGVPTIGEYLSRFWSNNQHENGFEGVLSRFRASSKELDWTVSQ